MIIEYQNLFVRNLWARTRKHMSLEELVKFNSYSKLFMKVRFGFWATQKPKRTMTLTFIFPDAGWDATVETLT